MSKSPLASPTFFSPTVYKQDTAPSSYDGGSYNEDAAVDLETFQNLLNKLEGSKKRQKRQESVEGRRDIYSQGLATMMSNF
jgi:hypothetical protein